MNTKHLLLGAVLGLPALCAGGAEAAKPPAYTFDPIGFSTTLKGIPEGERREECLDKGCTERGGVVVAEGRTTTLASPVTITIREHRQKGVGKLGLAAIAKKTLAHAPGGKQVRAVAGQAADRPALEQWSVWDGCQRVVSARVLVAMPDKVIEVETRSVLEPGHDSADASVGAMTKILQKLRVRRLGDATLDPAEEAIKVKDLAAAMPRSCAR